ncbi:ATP synthase, F0 complex, b' subunit [Campylobacter avium LMG 24591]|uniref:ATP synthase, F0 complex, b' subunit n=1 Tax=Campylobacter avium LMG 24591 TaxID=522484 RepID=A0A222MZ19_9BACT|nr:F0F1 ATP synthase subunit B' [Campylobacter avium]ASQ30978.1 ATP synthase, F0 complex, b' subunit [Campylobacter avium LMG 24591]OYD78790.1 ATP synthase, F0 complex, b' subunit [Campylobacter avium]
MFDDVHLSTMLTTIIVFLLMIFALNLLLYKPLLKFMQERDESIRSDEEKVKQDFKEVSNVAEELDKIKQNTREEIARIKQKAIESAKAEAEAEMSKKRKELEDKMLLFYKELAKDKEKLEGELKAFVPEWKNALNANIKNI